METECGYCGYWGKPIFVHSHYQCGRCGINIAPCCEGENCAEFEKNDEKTMNSESGNMSESL